MLACRKQPVDATPVWFMRQAGRYMPEYRAVRKRHSILEICKSPRLAAEVTITAAERLNVDAAIIFADLLLPLEVMGVPFRFEAGEGPKIETPIRTPQDVARVRDDRAADLNYVSESIKLVAKHFEGKLPVIGFCGAPFTLASYMIEGGGSRSYVETKRMMYNQPDAWDLLMKRLVNVLAAYTTEQVRAGARSSTAGSDASVPRTIADTFCRMSERSSNGCRRPALRSFTSARTRLRCSQTCKPPAPRSWASTGASRSTMRGSS
jgi:uroporphyrinogen decarboxylase